AGSFDLTSLLPIIRETANNVDPQASKQIDDALGELAKQSGVDVEKDIFSTLGSEWAFYADPTIGGQGVMSMTLVNRLKDPGKFELSMAKMEDFALHMIEQAANADNGPKEQIQLRFKTLDRDGLTIHYLATPAFAPCWVVRDGNLYVALF